jgi:hypothetical protein
MRRRLVEAMGEALGMQRLLAMRIIAASWRTLAADWLIRASPASKLLATCAPKPAISRVL